LTSEPVAPDDLARLETLIDAWLGVQLDENPVVAAVDRETDPDLRRWYVRLVGEQKATFSIWLTLDQRTLRYETYLMPAPEENEGQLYEHLLRRNRKLYGAALTIGDEDGIFLVGQLDVRHLDEDELDRIIGSLYAATEQFFRPAMRIGYASKFRG
jgi:hypothetical protein